MFTLIPQNYFCTIALLLSLALQRDCTFPQKYAPSTLSVHVYWNSDKPLNENTTSKQSTNETMSKKVPIYGQAQSGKAAKPVQTEKYIALISLIIIATSTIVRLTGIICKKFYEIDRLSHKIKAQNVRIKKIERNAELNRLYMNEIISLLRKKNDNLQQKVDNEIENKNKKINVLMAQTHNNQQAKQYKLKSGSG